MRKKNKAFGFFCSPIPVQATLGRAGVLGNQTDVMLMVVMMLAVDLHSRGKKDFDQRFEIRLSVIGMENDDDWLHFKQEQIYDVKLLEQVDWNGSKN